MRSLSVDSRPTTDPDRSRDGVDVDPIVPSNPDALRRLRRLPQTVRLSPDLSVPLDPPDRERLPPTALTETESRRRRSRRRDGRPGRSSCRSPSRRPHRADPIDSEPTTGSDSDRADVDVSPHRADPESRRSRSRDLTETESTSTLPISSETSSSPSQPGPTPSRPHRDGDGDRDLGADVSPYRATTGSDSETRRDGVETRTIVLSLPVEETSDSDRADRLRVDVLPRRSRDRRGDLTERNPSESDSDRESVSLDRLRDLTALPRLTSPDLTETNLSPDPESRRRRSRRRDERPPGATEPESTRPTRSDSEPTLRTETESTSRPRPS